MHISLIVISWDQMLDYLVQGRARRELFRLLWGQSASGNVSVLSRRAKVTFSAAHRELEAMRAAGLARAERTSTELVYRAESDHPGARLLRELAKSPVDARSEVRTDHPTWRRPWPKRSFCHTETRRWLACCR